MPSNSPTKVDAKAVPPGSLFVVATPIGNRSDITLRALNVLGEVDIIAAEDTRHTKRLLQYHGIDKSLISYHEHNEVPRATQLLNALSAGQSVALVTNAGTPLVSDPGYRLIKTVIDHGITVVPIPGPSAAIAALSVSGLPSDSFVFIGFAVRKKNKRRAQFEALADETRTLIFYENPRRVVQLLSELKTVLGDRRGVLAREMTKRHEEFLRGRLSVIGRQLQGRPAVKGECTLLVEGATAIASTRLADIEEDVKRHLRTEQLPLSDLAKQMAQKHHVAKQLIYDMALQLKKSNTFKR